MQRRNIWEGENLHHYLVVDNIGNTHLIFPDKNNDLDNKNWFFCRSRQEPSLLGRIIYIKAKDVVKIPPSQRSQQLVLNRPLVHILRTWFAINNSVVPIKADAEEFTSQIYPAPLLIGGITAHSEYDEYLWLDQSIKRLQRSPNGVAFSPGYLMTNNAFNDLLKLYYSYLHQNNLLEPARQNIETLITSVKINFSHIKNPIAENLLQNIDNNKIFEVRRKRNTIQDAWSGMKALSKVIFYYLARLILYSILLKIGLWWDTDTPNISFIIPTAVSFCIGSLLLGLGAQYYVTKKIQKWDEEITRLESERGKAIDMIACLEYQKQIKELEDYFAGYDERLRLEQEARHKTILQPAIPVNTLQAPVPEAGRSKSKKCLIM